MDLDLSPEDAQFRDEVRAFIQTHLAPTTRDALRAGRQLTKKDRADWHRTLARQGWSAARWPIELGGTGWNATRRLIFLEELHLGFAPEPLAFNTTMLGPVLIHFGTDQQKQRWLERVRNIDDWWAQGFSEPGSGSDLASLKTSARRDGDHYIVNGQKIWTTLGHHADWIFCLVRTDPEQKKQRGISFLLIDLKSPGVTVRPIITIDGRHEVNEVFFDNVRVPVDQLVGKENEGWSCAKFLLSYERTGVTRTGLAKVILQQVRASLPSIPHRRASLERKLCMLEVELRSVEITQYRLLCRPGYSDDAVDPMSSILKLMGSEIRQRATELLVEASGERALVSERERPTAIAPEEEALERAAETYYELRATTIYGGSSEIQKNIIAQAVLHLP